MLRDVECRKIVDGWTGVEWEKEGRLEIEKGDEPKGD
jgi:hypothetical protein